MNKTIKKKKSSGFRIDKQLLMPVMVIGLTMALIAGIFAFQWLNNASTPAEPEMSERDIAIKEAREIADKYLEAMRVCDRAKIDSYRMMPIQDYAFARCNAANQADLKITSGTLTSYDNSYDEDIKARIETAMFNPSVLKNGESQGPANPIMMTRYPDDDNTWKVFN